MIRKVGKKRLRWPIVAVGLPLLVLCGFGAYKLWFEQPTQQQIDEAVAAGDWQRVVSLINRADLALDDGQNYFNLGLALTNLGQDAPAIGALMEADDRGYKRAETRYQIATLYAKSDDPKMAMEWMNDAYDAGFQDEAAVEGNKYLGVLSKTVAWGEFFSRAAEPNGDPKKAFDFLVGTWSVARRSGFGNMSVTVTKLMDGAISEAWTGDSPEGSTGLYVMDPQTKRWRYTLVDGFGRTFSGSVLTGKQITISGTLTYADGTQILRRIEIRNSSGVVDHMIRESRDGGKSWDPEDRRRLTALSDQGRPNF